MFKIFIVAGWLFFALVALLILVSLISRDMGNDAAGRGMARAFGLCALAFAIAGGAGLYFSMRAHSWAGAIGSIVPLAIPLLFLFGADLEAYVHQFRSRLDSRKEGRYADPAESQLAQAIRSGDFAAMRRILATHPRLDGRDDAGFDLLSYAVMEARQARADEENARSIEGVKLLLDAGMAPNESREPDGSSTFAGLVSNLAQPMPDGLVVNPVGVELFHLFLAHGADPNTRKGKQPLIFSAWENPASLTEMLDRGADSNLRDENGDTALLFFLWNGRWEAALLMLEREADIGVRNQFGTTVEIAMANGQRLAADVLNKPLPEAYGKMKAALERRRAAGIR